MSRAEVTDCEECGALDVPTAQVPIPSGDVLRLCIDCRSTIDRRAGGNT